MAKPRRSAGFAHTYTRLTGERVDVRWTGGRELSVTIDGDEKPPVRMFQSRPTLADVRLYALNLESKDRTDYNELVRSNGGAV